MRLRESSFIKTLSKLLRTQRESHLLVTVMERNGHCIWVYCRCIAYRLDVPEALQIQPLVYYEHYIVLDHHVDQRISYIVLPTNQS